MNSPDTPNSISSPGSADGLSPSNSQAGHQTDLFAPVPVRASRSARRASNSGLPTAATSGPSFATSSPSANLQSRLASRLRARLAVYGSPEYVLTWKDWDMQSGPPICALRASGRRTSGNGSSGWPTPDTNQRGGAQDPAKRKAGGHSVTLQDAALLVGWNTPRATDGSNGGPNQTGGALPADAALAGWARPTCQDASNNAGPSQFNRNSLPLNCQVTLVSGQPPTSSPAPTEKRGALNPAHSRWLMGYPVAWDSCGATAMQSCRKSRRNSSKPSSKPETHAKP